MSSSDNLPSSFNDKYNKEMNMYAFIESLKDKHLTLGDFKKLKVGESLDVVIWDRNFEEYWIWENAKSKELFDPKIFFAENRCKIIYQPRYIYDPMSHIQFSTGETIYEPLHLDVSALETNWKWVAFDMYGMLHITSEIVSEGEEIPKEWKPKHLKIADISDSTRIGWRGPIMLWSHLEEKSKEGVKVYYEEINL